MPDRNRDRDPNLGERRLGDVDRLVCVVIVGVLWLIAAAVPVLADGGPHVVTVNNGSTGITADSCAGCHRAHTSQSLTGYLLTTPGTVTDFCLSCHGSSGTGATTDVENGVQYSVSSASRSSVVLGALRSGGFLQARIGSATAYRVRSSVVGTLDFNTKVPVGDPAPVTSAHLALSGSGVTPKGTTWGFGQIALSDPGTKYSGGLGCTSCHNPHGNGNYRILKSIPTDGGAVVAPTPVPVFDPPLPPLGDTRNYTVIQIKGTQGNNSSFLLYASQLASYSASAGDYFHRTVPWNSSSGANDAPNGRQQSGFVGSVLVKDFDTQMTSWCSSCHTRYHNTDGPASTTGDGIFSYQHVTNLNRACTTCHVAHGSNARMNADISSGTTFSSNVPYPDGSVSVGDSRLLKFDGRGTCLACHDPTGTIAVGESSGSVPNPLVP